MAALGWLLNLDFAGGAAATATRPVHYHELEGPATRTYILPGSSTESFELEGPSTATNVLQGAE